eukprot:TRINITY_DN16442_c0_g1_i1.p1 TRINITY_DN16442_c0_g1~~TRINITY_DN16442_c0_g1_i1.p1  ORF type:complete len:57 (-),score=3.48 TRINITY_DN16442_c0_g1_i1:270-440(-)
MTGIFRECEACTQKLQLSNEKPLLSLPPSRTTNKCTFHLETVQTQFSCKVKFFCAV